MIAEPNTKAFKPLPTPSEENQPFWEGLQKHEFRVQRCKKCSAYHWLPTRVCPNCLTEHNEDIEWVKVSGEGTVFTYSIVYRPVPVFEDDVPYITAAIELKERPLKCLVLSWVVNCKPEDIYCGMPVKVIFEDIPDEDITLFKFVPASPKKRSGST